MRGGGAIVACPSNHPTEGEGAEQRRLLLTDLLQLYKLSRLPSAIVVVALTAALCRHLRLDRLQLGVMVLLWLPRWRRLLSPHSGKVRPGSEGNFLVVRQPLRQIRAIGDDNPLVGHKAGNAIVVAENRSCDLLAGAGGADMVLQGRFAELPQVFECGSESLPAPRVACFIAGLDGSFVVSIDASIMCGLVITEKSISWP